METSDEQEPHDDSIDDDGGEQSDDYDENFNMFDELDTDNYAANALRALDDYNDHTAVDDNNTKTDDSARDDPSQGYEEDSDEIHANYQPPRSATTTIHRRTVAAHLSTDVAKRKKPSNVVSSTGKFTKQKPAAAAMQKRAMLRGALPRTTVDSDPYKTTDDDDDERQKMVAKNDSCVVTATSRMQLHPQNSVGFASDDKNDSFYDSDAYQPDASQQSQQRHRLPHLWPPQGAMMSAVKSKQESTAAKSLSSATKTDGNKSSENTNGKKPQNNLSSLFSPATDLGLKLPVVASSEFSLLSSTTLLEQKQQHASLDELPACARCRQLDQIHEQTVETLQQQVRELKDKNGRLTQLVDEQTYRIDKLEKEQQKFDDSQELLGVAGATNSQELLGIKAMELSRKNRELTARLESMKNKYESALKKIESLEHQLDATEAKRLTEHNNNEPDSLAKLQDDFSTMQQKYTAAKEKAALMTNAQQMLKTHVEKLTTLLRRELGPDCDLHKLIKEAIPQWQGRDEQLRALRAKVEQQRKHLEELMHQKLTLLQKDGGDYVSNADDAVSEINQSHHRLHAASNTSFSTAADSRNKRHLLQLDKDRRAQQDKTVSQMAELHSKCDDYKRKWQNEKSRNEYLQQQTQLLSQTNRQLTQAFEKDEKIIEQLNDELQSTKKRARHLQRDESEMLWKMQRRIEQIERQTQLDMLHANSSNVSALPSQATPSSQQQPSIPWDAEFAGLKRQINEFVELAVPLKKLYSDLVVTNNAASHGGSPVGSSSNVVATSENRTTDQNRLIRHHRSPPPIDVQKNLLETTSNSRATCMRGTDRDSTMLEELTFVRDENAQLSRSLKDVLDRLQKQAVGCSAASVVPGCGDADGGADQNDAASICASSAVGLHSGHARHKTNKWANVKSKLPPMAISSRSSTNNRQQLPTTLASSAVHSSTNIKAVAHPPFTAGL